MDFVLVSFGTIGDINPYVALGVALKSRGYGVKFLANEHFKYVVEGHGLEFVQVGTSREFQEIVNHECFFHPVKSFNFVVHSFIIRYIREFYVSIVREANGQTVIISQSFLPATRIVHEKYHLPYITVNLQPFSFWSYAKPPLYPGLKLPNGFPGLRYRILKLINKLYIDKKFAIGINPFLNEIGLKSRKNFFSEWLYSPQLVIGTFPGWFAQPACDWPANTKLTGFIAHEEQQELPVKVAEFLRNGKPPVVFTFGSSMNNIGKFFNVAVDAVNKMGIRAILISANPAEIAGGFGDNILVSGYMPFGGVFPYVGAIVHHGGIGTISHAIAAGKPQLLVPFAHDQPDNAARAADLGVALILSPGKFTVRALMKNLYRLLNSETIKVNCSNYATLVNFQESVDNLANTIEEFAISHYASNKPESHKEDLTRFT